MMKTITEEKFKSALDKADQSEKEILKKLFPEQFDQENPYLKACKKLGETPLAALIDRSNSDIVSSDAFYRLTICIRAKNMINGKVWKQVYNGSEKHWFPRFIKNKAGFGLASTDYDCWDSYSDVGERLEYRTEELLREGVEEFKELYNDYLTV